MEGFKLARLWKQALIPTLLRYKMNFLLGSESFSAHSAKTHLEQPSNLSY